MSACHNRPIIPKWVNIGTVFWATVLKENPGIQWFIWDYTQNVHCIIHRIKCAGATFAAAKAQICLPEVTIIGQTCNVNGRIAENSKVNTILNWPPLSIPKEVQRFLKLCGRLRIWIPNYSKIVQLLTELYYKGAKFIWDKWHQTAFDEIKQFITTVPTLWLIDYTVDNAVILAVDSSTEAAGMILYQMSDNGKTHHPAWFWINFYESNWILIFSAKPGIIWIIPSIMALETLYYWY